MSHPRANDDAAIEVAVRKILADRGAEKQDAKIAQLEKMANESQLTLRSFESNVSRLASKTTETFATAEKAKDDVIRIDERLKGVDRQLGNLGTVQQTHGNDISAITAREKTTETKLNTIPTDQQIGDTVDKAVNRWTLVAIVIGLALAVIGFLLGQASRTGEQRDVEQPATIRTPTITELQNALSAMRQEEQVIGASLGEGNPIVIIATVKPDGTNRDDYAQYLCQVLNDFELGGGERVQVVSSEGASSGKMIGSANCAG